VVFTFGTGQVVRSFSWTFFRSWIGTTSNLIAFLYSPHVHVFQGAHGGAISLLASDTAGPSPLVSDLEEVPLRIARWLTMMSALGTTKGHRSDS
jgi:hypothetical protein